MKGTSLFAHFAILFLAGILCSCDELPREVEISNIPEYYWENGYLENRVQAINDSIEECSGDCLTFFWITDIHWEPELNTRNAPLLIKYISSKTGIDKVLNGGDTGNSQIICKNAIARLMDAIGSNQVFSVNGNHETNDASRYEKPYDRVADELRSHNSNVIYGDKNKSFFYFDDKEVKIRFIGLSAYGLYFNNVYESCYTPDQLSWFRNTALDVEAGWTIVIFTHSMYSLDIDSDRLITDPSGSVAFIEAIDGYNGAGTIACVLMGHTHRDRLHIGNTGIPYIITASDRHATYYGDINVERVPGTISEQHFEVVVIDKGKRQVKLFSIGAFAKDGIDDDPGKDVDVRIVNF